MTVTKAVPGFEPGQNQLKVKSELKKTIQSKEIPNAFLFTGNQNTGRKEIALFFAKALNCLNSSNNPCNICRSCKKIDAKMHPDILLLACEEKKKSITIAQIRDLHLQISSKPNEAKFRVILIQDAEKMNTQAQNGLLKILEEPPEKTFFILLARNINALLSTILSRCRHIRFKPLSLESTAKHLVKEYDIEPQEALIASNICLGDPKKALMFCSIDQNEENIDWVKRRVWIIESTADILMNTVSVSQNILKGLKIAEKLSLEPDLLNDSFQIIRSFFRDIAVYNYNSKSIINSDFLNSFKDICQKYPYNTVSGWLKNLYETEKKIGANTTVRLTLEHFYLGLALTKEI